MSLSGVNLRAPCYLWFFCFFSPQAYLFEKLFTILLKLLLIFFPYQFYSFEKKKMKREGSSMKFIILHHLFPIILFGGSRWKWALFFWKRRRITRKGGVRVCIHLWIAHSLSLSLSFVIHSTQKMALKQLITNKGVKDNWHTKTTVQCYFFFYSNWFQLRSTKFSVDSRRPCLFLPCFILSLSLSVTDRRRRRRK